jgi:nucleotide-binding universal stress UspA family protein
MFEKIIYVSSEISPISPIALQSIRTLQALGTKSCLVIQCQPVFDVDESTMIYLTGQFERSLMLLKQDLANAGFEVDTRIAFGLTRAEAARIAEEEGCSLIVAAAAEHSMLGGMLYGNIAYEIIHNNTKPVLLIRLPSESEPAAELAAGGNLLEHILFPTDFSENAQTAFKFLKTMVENGAVGRITLYHVQDKARITPDKLSRLDEFNAADHQLLSGLLAELQAAGAPAVDIQLSFGSPSAETIHFIKEHGVSLVVMGSQGRGFIKEVFLGSVSNNIARHSAASVLLVPAEREQD